MSTVSVSRTIAAPPEQVWGLIADLPRMGEWSPENTGGRWVGGATGPALGARFKGTNTNGRRRWSTMVKVTRCDPGSAFAFHVSAVGLGVADWVYDIEPHPEGCTVTETWVDSRGALVKALGGPVSGVADRAEHNRAGMAATLAALAAAAEAPA